MPAAPNVTLQAGYLPPAQFPELARTRAVRVQPGLSLPRGQVLGEVQVAAADEVQTITLGGTPDGGSFRLMYGVGGPGLDFTPAINWSGTGATLAANIQAALDALFGAGQVVVTGTGPFTLTFSGSEVAGRAIGLPQVLNNLTGTDPTVTPETDTPGSPGLVGVFGPYDDAATDGRQVARAVLAHPLRTDDVGRPIDQFGPDAQAPTAAVYDRGDFYCSDLVGLDASAVADLGKILSGSALTVPGAILRIGV